MNLPVTIKTSVIACYLVIIAGGVVRCTGSGMGCPDWPKCFGLWIPPTHVSQLPIGYEYKYSHGSYKAAFNVYKTWTEYINRLLGAVFGLVVIALVVQAHINNTKYKRIHWWAWAALICTLFQGWLGAKVVSSVLAPYMITIHMLMALIIFGILIYMLYRCGKDNYAVHYPYIKYVILASLVITLLQIVLGTQVRQQIDKIASYYHYDFRELWVNNLGVIFSYHRLLAYIVVAGTVLTAYHMYNNNNKIWAYILILIVGLEFASGLVLTYFELLPYLQPLHLACATALSGVQFFLLLSINITSK
ncbi:MAG: COX15/CtaA family protein [Cytophagales bacterium]|nr:COX15/CtaA family protein [Cytophagales bacterium]